ncbi:YciI family protein [Gallaecimonas kandeliae]|uniref:YciI family protein n=1 Tax=Gallaecimonas kandeliae TaxID=3029055 RepID=UPI0026487588|nr:YciI family protein [Gallaecimonas kandeliae]WKE64808.1 YciI family protein [Gallaecimonas kandeliae]
MKYLALVYYQEAALAELSQGQWDELNQECLACVAGLQGSGHMLGGEALLGVDSATTVRVRNGRVQITDGPFSETKEQLAGFYLLEARDLNEAISLAGRIPPARYGCVEVRPVRQLAASDNVHYQERK